MAPLRYWLWLSTRGLQPALAFRVLEHFGAPERAYFADPAEYDLIPGLSDGAKERLRRQSLEEAERILGDCDRLGLRILTLGDADYPERLKNIYDPPLVLYIRGRLPHFDEEAAVALVGARRPSAYGRRMAGKLGRELAAGGGLVVSGIAQGLDTEALQGALKGGGRAVSVLGNGIDVPYPWQSRFLYEDVAAAGALISEYPPGTEPAGWHFPIRNRIISGLSLGVVAVECALRSGTMITVGQALDQDRDVFAVPGNADAPMSEGPNRLIQQGAKLVTCGWDVLREYAGRFPDKLRSPAPAPLPEGAEEAAGPGAPAGPEAPRSPSSGEKTVDKPLRRAYSDVSGLTEDQRAVLSALEGAALTSDELVERTGLPARRVLSALTLLQIQGYLTELPGKRFEILGAPAEI